MDRTWIIIIVGGAFILEVGIISLIVTYLRKKAVAKMEDILSELRQDIVIQPQTVNYRGSRRDYGRVKNGGYMALTSGSLVFVSYGGRMPIIIPIKSIAEVDESNAFYGSANIRKVMIIKTVDGNELAFITMQNNEWVESIKRRINN